MIIYLDSKNLPQEIYDTHDLSTLEDTLLELLSHDNLGEYDGNEFSEDETTLYFYTNDAEKLFSIVKPTLEMNPLCKNARVIVRKGVLGSLEVQHVLA